MWDRRHERSHGLLVNTLFLYWNVTMQAVGWAATKSIWKGLLPHAQGCIVPLEAGKGLNSLSSFSLSCVCSQPLGSTIVSFLGELR